jgi:hypothetical protein
MTQEIQYNPTCAMTGRKDNLRMYAHRNDQGEMVGWVFLHESINVQDIEFIFSAGFKPNKEKLWEEVK